MVYVKYFFLSIAFLGLAWNVSGQVKTGNLSNYELYQLVLTAKDSGDLHTQAEAYLQLAENDLYTIENDDRAIKNYLNAIDAFRKLHDSARVAEVQADLARLYAEQEYYEEALNYLHQVLKFYEGRKDTMMQGRILNQLGDTYLSKGNIELAISFLKKSREFNLIVRDTLLHLINSITLATIAESGESIVYDADSTLQAFTRRETNIDPGFKSSALLNAGIYYMRQKKYPLALYYFDKSREAATKNPVRLRNAYKHISACYKEMGDFETAFLYLNKYSQLNDSILNARRTWIINELLITKQTREKEAQIIDLENQKKLSSMSNRAQKIITFSLLFGSIIVLFGAYITIRLYQQRLNTNQVISKQKEELTQSRITELENNLKIETMHSMLQGQEAERERIAKDLHDSLGGLLSTIKLHFDSVTSKLPAVEAQEPYQKANQLLDEACKEVRNISNNMQPGALLKLGILPAIKDLINRIQGEDQPDIEFQHFGINGDLESTLSLNIYRIIQELLINSIKHANADEILIQLIEKDNEIIVMVEDDGNGYDVELVAKGMGTGNIASRVKYLKGELSIDSELGKGTTTMITIPLEEASSVQYTEKEDLTA